MTAAELRQYALANPLVPEFEFSCPTCGRVRVLQRQYVLRSLQTKFRYCAYCKPRGKRNAPVKMVRCKRCNKTRPISVETFNDGKHSPYCTTCQNLRRHGQTGIDEAWAARTRAALPEQCNPLLASQYGRRVRMVWCLHYNKCLDVAVAEQWPNFTCKRCTGFEREPVEMAYGETWQQLVTESGAEYV